MCSTNFAVHVKGLIARRTATRARWPTSCKDCCSVSVSYLVDPPRPRNSVLSLSSSTTSALDTIYTSAHHQGTLFRSRNLDTSHSSSESTRQISRSRTHTTTLFPVPTHENLQHQDQPPEWTQCPSSSAASRDLHQRHGPVDKSVPPSSWWGFGPTTSTSHQYRSVRLCASPRLLVGFSLGPLQPQASRPRLSTATKTRQSQP